MDKSAIKDGLKDRSAITQKKPREDTTGQRPKARQSTVKGEQGSFKIK